ncbi:hypothetical protein WICPIJ_006523 [Wickerhamomyces pijperi]|uniref:Uncharacterized protein n=1 Tax=Wickerhamomyces pijperi TaxID=599730 RepID=A0A9P8Q1Y4_WICPI|nr:hypothetical protein WICPIJ_006523 [Wickerhamomyces pijperi]
MIFSQQIVTSLVMVMMTMSVSEAAWYSAEDKVCDPTGSNWSRYTGFRIHRHLVLKRILPPMDHYVTISRCNDGEVVYERIERAPSDIDISWDRPICLLKEGLKVTPGSKLKRPSNKETAGAKVKREEKGEEEEVLEGPLKHLMKIDDVPKKPHSLNPLKGPHFHPPHKDIVLDDDEDAEEEEETLEKRDAAGKPRTDSYLNGHIWSQKAKEKYISFVKSIQRLGGFMDVAGGTQNKNFEEIQPLDLKSFNEIGDLENLQCFKMARRKNFVNRRMTLGIPNSFVGGLFLCNISDEAKRLYLESLSTQDSQTLPFKFECDTSNAIPILPLLLDNMLNSWYTRENWGYRQRIPYLYTPSSLDYRFGTPAEFLGYKTPHLNNDLPSQAPGDRLHYDKWYEEIHVNEQYSLKTSSESESIDMVGTIVINTYLDMIEGIQKSLNASLRFDGKGSTTDLKQMSHVAVEDILLEMIPKINDTQKIEKYLKKIQSTWDSLNLTKEVFTYKLAS